mmetsp:Transcript_30352/g.89948  ORF Transcript_30352/g.89948 Transcript_30352/m.89948 type:complete len:440 (-) Transcript_30352:514-1833(-)
MAAAGAGGPEGRVLPGAHGRYHAVREAHLCQVQDAMLPPSRGHVPAAQAAKAASAGAPTAVSAKPFAGGAAQRSGACAVAAQCASREGAGPADDARVPLAAWQTLVAGDMDAHARVAATAAHQGGACGGGFGVGLLLRKRSTATHDGPAADGSSLCGPECCKAGAGAHGAAGGVRSAREDGDLLAAPPAGLRQAVLPAPSAGLRQAVFAQRLAIQGDVDGGGHPLPRAHELVDLVGVELGLADADLLGHLADELVLVAVASQRLSKGLLRMRQLRSQFLHLPLQLLGAHLVLRVLRLLPQEAVVPLGKLALQLLHQLLRALAIVLPGLELRLELLQPRGELACRLLLLPPSALNLRLQLQHLLHLGRQRTGHVPDLAAHLGLVCLEVLYPGLQALDLVPKLLGLRAAARGFRFEPHGVVVHLDGLRAQLQRRGVAQLRV